MLKVMIGAWSLFLGMMLLTLGNGMQGTLLGIRGPLEGFSTTAMSGVMSAYFAGFLGGSLAAPALIRKVGHVRVFAALGSLISAILILYPTITEPVAWIVLRALIGFCFSGVYVTAESWLNNTATNQTRGQTLSAYMIVQMSGIVVAQYVIVFGDPAGFVLFIIPSVLVSLSFAPILLSATHVPPYEAGRTMSLRRLFATAPTSTVGMFLMGGVISAQFGMAAVYGSLAGLTIAQIATLTSAFYVGGMICQYPIGWASDRIDRRKIILAGAIAGALAALVGLLAGQVFALLCVAAFGIGGMSNPLYALLIAYTNDYLEPQDMASASGALVFIYGLGAILGPLIVGGLMAVIGPPGYFAMIAGIMGVLSAYVAWRMTQRASAWDEDSASYAAISPSSTPVAVTAAQEYYVEGAAGDADPDAANAAETGDGRDAG